MARRQAWYRKGVLGASPINLTEHDIERTQNSAHIGKHRFAAKEIHRRKMCEARRPDLAAVRPVGAIRDKINAELSFGASTAQ
jgi:hypothetical protein